jgi:hypothetical protein
MGGAMTEQRGIWMWRDEQWEDTRDPFDGFDVITRDGKLGSVEEARYETGSSYVVVNTGTWVFGEKALIPAGLVDRVDRDAKALHVDLTEEQIGTAPPFDGDAYTEDDYREAISRHYADLVVESQDRAGLGGG